MNYSQQELHEINGQRLPLSEVYALLDAFSTSELEAEEQAILRHHLVHCSTCQHILIEVEQFHRLLNNVLPEQALAAQSEATETSRLVPKQPQIFSDSTPPLQVGKMVSEPQQTSKHQGIFQATGTRLLIAAIVLLLLGTSLLIFRDVLPQLQQTQSPHSTATLAGTHTPTATRLTGSGWQHLWTMPAMPEDKAPVPWFGWSQANPQRLYLCRVSNLWSTEYNNPDLFQTFYRSDDQGQHWQTYSLPQAVHACNIKVDPTNANILTLLDNVHNPLVSRDGGLHWQTLPNPPGWTEGTPPIQVVAGRVYAGGYWTQDLTHWTRWYPGSQSYPSFRGGWRDEIVQVNPQHPDTLYTAVESADYLCTNAPSLDMHAIELCRSDDGGKNWRFLTKILTLDHRAYIPSFCLVTNHPDILYASASDTIRSTNGGQTWEKLPEYLHGSTDLTCEFDSNVVEQSAQVDATKLAVGQEVQQWNKFSLTADGTLYHFLDQNGTRQGIGLPEGVALLTNTGWKQIAPYPPLPKTVTTMAVLHVMVFTSASGESFALAYTADDIYIYHLRNTKNM